MKNFDVLPELPRISNISVTLYRERIIYVVPVSFCVIELCSLVRAYNLVIVILRVAMFTGCGEAQLGLRLRQINGKRA